LSGNLGENMSYEFYVADIESTGLDDHDHDVIELSLLRIRSGEQKTWSLKPLNPATISLDALRVNGHKLEDLLHQTKAGRERYLLPQDVIVDVENWVLDDGVPAANRCLVGQNIPFDLGFLRQLWKKCNSEGSFPFGRRYMDTMQIEMFLDYCKDVFDEGYSLANLTKKYGVKNDKAHSAAADTKATKEVFVEQVSNFRKILNK
jgi:DNA polymerase III alpha subunit (gram-positive type)